ncbi:MAG: DNA translocase FtsK 4TM domain-containing protein [Acidimicrobiales bacterium]
MTTKRVPSRARHARSPGRGGSGKPARPGTAAGRATTSRSAPGSRARSTSKSKSPRSKRKQSQTRESLAAVLSDHKTDLWALALVTVAILGAVALYGGSLGPVGRGIRDAAGDLLGTGRFALPAACLVAGILLIAERSAEREPIRAVLGLGLSVWSISGLAAVGGGAPRITAPAHELAGAGGWLGAAACDPLRAGLGSFGAAVVLIAVLGCALIVLTGVSLRAVVAGTASFARYSWGRLTETAEALSSVGEVVIKADTSQARSRYAGVDYSQMDIDIPLDDPLDDPVADEISAEEIEDPGIDADTPAPVAARPAPARPKASGPSRQLELELGSTPGNWRLPHVGILARSRAQAIDRGEIAVAGRSLVDALAAHGVETRLVGHTVGPTVTRYELELGPGVKVARVTSLAKDIAYAMASPDVRILAPIPGMSAIGIEVPNRKRQLVTLGDVLSSEEAKQAVHPLEVGLGRDIAGRAVMANLADMPHILISGATGAGKSSCINSLLTSILVRTSPEQVRLILVDPKRVELGQYNGLPHLLTQVVVDPKKAANALAWAVTEMERRYDLLAEVGMRDITGYNTAIDRGELGDPTEGGDLVDSEDPDSEDPDSEDPEGEIAGDEKSDSVASRVAEVRSSTEPIARVHNKLPFILVVVDELNDLMMVAARDVEDSVCRIAQMARAVGIHLVLATQRPSVDVITGVIKANIPSRLAFSVSSLADSRVILDQPGAERLIGKGDMLLLTASSSVPRRIQGPWVTEDEVRAVVAHWRRQSKPEYVEGIAGDGVQAGATKMVGEDDELLDKALETVVLSQLGSTSMLQRKLQVGFARAGRLMDLLENKGVVGPPQGSKPRAVLMTIDEYQQSKEAE